MQNEQAKREVLTNGEICLSLMPDNAFELFIEFILAACESQETD